MSDSIFIGGGGPDHKTPQNLLLARANRHGLVAGATGTGKTVTLQIMAEQFSAAGVPVFCADVKGDLSGICMAATPDRQRSREDQRARRPDRHARPSPMPPPPASSGTSTASAAIRSGRRSPKWARSSSPACCSSTTPRKASSRSPSSTPTTTTSCCSTSRTCARCWPTSPRSPPKSSRPTATSPPPRSAPSSASSSCWSGKGPAVLRRARPRTHGLHAHDHRRPRLCERPGRNHAHQLAAPLFHLPPVAAGRAVRTAPEVGDPDKPKLVFFFDEAHLLFNDAPKALLDKIEQVVRLIRSKGVGVYFVTQNPARPAGERPRPARLPHPARPARLHPHRAQGRQGRRPELPPQSRNRHRNRHHRTRHRRGAGLDARHEGRAHRGGAHHHSPAILPPRPRRPTRRRAARPGRKAPSR